MRSERSSFPLILTLGAVSYSVLLAEGVSDGLTDLFLAHYQLFLPLDANKFLVNQVHRRLEFGSIVLVTISHCETYQGLQEETQLKLVKLVRCQGKFG